MALLEARIVMGALGVGRVVDQRGRGQGGGGRVAHPREQPVGLFGIGLGQVEVGLAAFDQFLGAGGLGPLERLVFGLPGLGLGLQAERDHDQGADDHRQHQSDRGQSDLVLGGEALEQLPGAVVVGPHPTAGHEGIDLLDQILGGAVALGALLAQAAFGHRGQLGRRISADLAHRDQRLLADLQHGVHRRVADIRRPPGQDLVEHRPQAPDVRALVDGIDLAAGLFGAHVGRGADGRAGGGFAGIGLLQVAQLALDVVGPDVALAGHLGHAPIQHHRLAELADHDVVGLDVAVDHAARVSESDRLAHVPEGAQQLEPLFQRLAGLELAGQGVAAHEAHGVVEGAVLAAAHLVHRHDAGVLELAGHPRLAQKTHRARGRALQRVRGVQRPLAAAGAGDQLLDGHLAADVLVDGQQDARLAAGGVLALHGVAAGLGQADLLVGLFFQRARVDARRLGDGGPIRRAQIHGGALAVAARRITGSRQRSGRLAGQGLARVAHLALQPPLHRAALGRAQHPVGLQPVGQRPLRVSRHRGRGRSHLGRSAEPELDGIDGE